MTPMQTSSTQAGFGRIVSLLITFMLGYMVAQVWTLHEMMGYAEKAWGVDDPQPSRPKDEVVNDIGKSKLEFYTLLTKTSSQPTSAQPANTDPKAVNPTPHPIPSDAPALAATEPHRTEAVVGNNTNIPQNGPQILPAPTTPPTAHDINGRYFLQVGAFNRLPEAEKLQMRMQNHALKTVVRVGSQGGAQWYRVFVGPYAQEEAQKIQGYIAQHEHIVGMMRKE